MSLPPHSSLTQMLSRSIHHGAGIPEEELLLPQWLQGERGALFTGDARAYLRNLVHFTLHDDFYPQMIAVTVLGCLAIVWWGGRFLMAARSSAFVATHKRQRGVGKSVIQIPNPLVIAFLFGFIFTMHALASLWLAIRGHKWHTSLRLYGLVISSYWLTFLIGSWLWILSHFLLAITVTQSEPRTNGESRLSAILNKCVRAITSRFSLAMLYIGVPVFIFASALGANTALAARWAQTYSDWSQLDEILLMLQKVPEVYEPPTALQKMAISSSWEKWCQSWFLVSVNYAIWTFWGAALLLLEILGGAIILLYLRDQLQQEEKIHAQSQSELHITRAEAPRRRQRELILPQLNGSGSLTMANGTSNGNGTANPFASSHDRENSDLPTPRETVDTEVRIRAASPADRTDLGSIGDALASIQAFDRPPSANAPSYDSMAHTHKSVSSFSRLWRHRVSQSSAGSLEAARVSVLAERSLEESRTNIALLRRSAHDVLHGVLLPLVPITLILTIDFGWFASHVWGASASGPNELKSVYVTFHECAAWTIIAGVWGAMVWGMFDGSVGQKAADWVEKMRGSRRGEGMYGRH